MGIIYVPYHRDGRQFEVFPETAPELDFFVVSDAMAWCSSNDTLWRSYRYAERPSDGYNPYFVGGDQFGVSVHDPNTYKMITHFQLGGPSSPEGLYGDLLYHEATDTIWGWGKNNSALGKIWKFSGKDMTLAATYTPATNNTNWDRAFENRAGGIGIGRLISSAGAGNLTVDWYNSSGSVVATTTGLAFADAVLRLEDGTVVKSTSVGGYDTNLAHDTKRGITWQLTGLAPLAEPWGRSMVQNADGTGPSVILPEYAWRNGPHSFRYDPYRDVLWMSNPGHLLLRGVRCSDLSTFYYHSETTDDTLLSDGSYAHFWWNEIEPTPYCVHGIPGEINWVRLNI